LIKAKKWISVL